MIALPRFRSGTIEALKWFGFALMVLDHVDAFWFHRQLTWACAFGRLVFPVFAFILGYHLSRPDALRSGLYARVLTRLLVFGVIAQFPHGFLTHAALGLFPLNVLATFAVAVGVIWLTELGLSFVAFLTLLVGGALVEYGWPGVGLCVGVWMLYRRPSALHAVIALAAWALLYVENGSFLALWAVPVIVLASRLDLTVPRLRSAFYWLYPAHLLVFAQVVMLRDLL